MSSTVIIITVPTKPPTQENAAQSVDTVYDSARAIIADAEANDIPIVFRNSDETPAD